MTAAACVKVMPVSVYPGTCVLQCSAVWHALRPQVHGIGRTLVMARQQHMHIGAGDALAWAGSADTGSMRQRTHSPI